MKRYFIYILTNWNNEVMYIGVTNNPERRQWQHHNKQNQSFTQRYNVNKLVYLEETSNILDAIAREKQLKGWRRDKKNKLVESMNPNWLDLLDANEERSLACARDDKGKKA
ncbi:MAG: GIY-YIG nuclease family protein [Rickettsiales bacterium]|jgi:putative endonuclease|nr:GIY-YIG nuclease family protein [Rickettsiales bacterium]